MDDWAKQIMEKFFQSRSSPSREECDARALSILEGGAKAVRPVDDQGSLSYTVIGTTSVVISFRKDGSKLDAGMIKLAEEIHGKVAPGATYHGRIGESEASEPPLSVYTMPLLPGTSALNALAFSASMDEVEEAKHTRYVKDLAQYFARTWLHPQPVNLSALKTHEQIIRHKLGNLEESIASHDYLRETLAEVDGNLHKLFDQDYPQVLTHGDLSLTNILLSEDNLSITGIVDWSLASILPFGLELDTLRLTTGTMDMEGWFDFECRARLDVAFWNEFWCQIGISDEQKQKEIRTLAEMACKLGAILRYAFKRDTRGSSTDVVITHQAPYLPAWLGNKRWSDLVLREKKAEVKGLPATNGVGVNSTRVEDGKAAK
ncbi:hypothetical protein GGR56DRAFT_612316 [Xylariaceae sp. FL0804]|nr:hypothetical protein GGR56DRAFT_612316 [Xylariaceae sp. FL0804]